MRTMMEWEAPFDGTAVVWCEGGFGMPCGKTAHGLVRRTLRYAVQAVIDRRHAGRDAGEVLDGGMRGIPVVEGLDCALEVSRTPATHLVIGLAPDGGRWPAVGREAARLALERARPVALAVLALLGPVSANGFGERPVLPSGGSVGR